MSARQKLLTKIKRNIFQETIVYAFCDNIEDIGKKTGMNKKNSFTWKSSSSNLCSKQLNIVGSRLIDTEAMK